MEEKAENVSEVRLSDVIEKVLVESDLSISAFARKVGYSRQYIYDLLKKKDGESSRKVQLDTLKTICDATGYGLARLLADLGYIPKPKEDWQPGTILIVKKEGIKEYILQEADAQLLENVAKTVAE